MNLAHTIEVRANAAMIRNSAGAFRAIDGRTDEDFCAVLPFIYQQQSKTWWKVFFSRRLNIALLEIYFKSVSK